MQQPADPNYNYIEVLPHQMGHSSAETTGTFKMHSNNGHRVKVGRSCDTHKSEEMRLFCATCNILVCQFCFLEHHRSHKVERLQDAIMRHKKKVVGIVQNLQQDLNDWERFLSGLNQREHNLQSALKIEEEKIVRCVETLVQEVVAQKDRIIAELQQNEQPQFDMIEREKKHVHTAIAKLNEAITTSPLKQTHNDTDQEFLTSQLMFMSEVEAMNGQSPPSLKNLDTRVAVSTFTAKTLPADIKVGKLKKSSYESHALIKPHKRITRHGSLRDLSNSNLSAISASQECLLNINKPVKINYETSIKTADGDAKRISMEGILSERRKTDTDIDLEKPTQLRQKKVQIMEPNMANKKHDKSMGNGTVKSKEKPVIRAVTKPATKPVTKPKPVKGQHEPESPKGARTKERRQKIVVSAQNSEMFRADQSRVIRLILKDGFGRFQGASNVAATPSGPIAVLDATMYQIRVFSFHKASKKYKQQLCFTIDGDQEPQAIAITPSGLLVVAYKSGVDMYSASGKEKTTIFKTGHKRGVKYLFSEQQDDGLMSIAVTTKFIVLVGNVDTSKISVLSPADGNVIKILKTPIHPWFIATNDVLIAISDHMAEKICVMELASGRALFTANATKPKGICFHPESRSLLVVQGKIVQGKKHQCSIEQYCCTTGEHLGQAVEDMGKGSVKDLVCTSQGTIAVAATGSVKLYGVQYAGGRDSVVVDSTMLQS